MYYQAQNQFGLTFDQVRKMFPSKSFPADGQMEARIDQQASLSAEDDIAVQLPQRRVRQRNGQPVNMVAYLLRDSSLPFPCPLTRGPRSAPRGHDAVSTIIASAPPPGNFLPRIPPGRSPD